MYISQGSFKQEYFLKRLSIHLTGSEKHSYSILEEVWYLGGGCWSAKLEVPEHRLWRLINPSYRDEDISDISMAMQILITGGRV